MRRQHREGRPSGESFGVSSQITAEAAQYFPPSPTRYHNTSSCLSRSLPGRHPGSPVCSLQKPWANGIPTALSHSAAILAGQVIRRVCSTLLHGFAMVRLHLWIFTAVLLSSIASAQQNPNIAEATHPLGFTLKKVVSNTTIPTGAPFSYTIYFSFPAGTQNVTITDVLPPPLLFHSLSVTNACGSFTPSTPSPGTNGTVSVTWNSLPPSGCSGSLTIVVSFPNGTTCNGTSVRNRVCLVGTVLLPQGQQQTAEFCTPFVSTTAQASNPWTIDKQVLNSTYIGGGCQRALNSDTVAYAICVSKTPGTQGQLNLVNGIVTDVLPAGAQFISASCPGVSVSGNTITWNVGNLSATPMYNSVCCTVTVYYPPSQFPTGSQITNTATLTGLLGSAQQPCDQFTKPATICWQKILPPPQPPTTQATLYKWVSTNGQPGCSGQYTVGLCNTGNTPITSATITDTVPSGLTITSTSSSGGLSISTVGNTVTATLSTPLAAGQCRWLYINFAILSTATPNTTVTNCAWAQIPGLSPLHSCASFVVQAPAPSACIFKEICAPQPSYSLGQTLRIRLRLQNIGGQNITGATITDNLNPNFEYVGNPAFYTTTVWNTPCNPPNATPWLPAPSLSVSGQTLTISNVNIPATCQNLFWNGCGFYGNTGVPYYWVEFDVKIRDTAGLGNIPNSFTLSGGGLPQPVQSNTVYVLVTGNTGFTLNKHVASDTTNWQSSLVTSAGSVAHYRLQLNIPTGSVPLRHVTFVDLLPMDNGSADDKILQACVSRGSQFPLAYNGSFTATPAANGFNNPATALADANAISAATGAPNLFPNKCGTAGTWSTGLPAGAKNIGFYFPTAIGASTGATVVLPVKVDANAQPGQLACNTFAAGGAVRHYLNSTTSTDVPVGPLESALACMRIDTATRCYRMQLHGAPQPVGIVPTPAGNACKYTVTVTVNNPGPAVQGCASSAHGTVSPSTFTVPTGTTTMSFTFIDVPPPNSVACIRYGILDAAGQCTPCDSVCFDLRPCPQPDTCCPRFEKVEIKCLGRDSVGNALYSLVASGVIPCKATLLLSSPEGSFTPSAFGIGPGAFTIGTTFTDVAPPAPGAIVVYYAVIGQGVVLCRDSARLRLPPCPPTPRNCCDGWFRSLQSTVKWFSNGVVQITGAATAGPAPIHRFSAAIVSAQLKRWCPIIPPVPSPWQRIFGDITSGWLVPTPGAPQMLAPYSRQITWEGPLPDSCKPWSKQPATFQLQALFPAPGGFKCGDSLRFTVRYTFTDCECRTCDTLITYTVVRKKWFDDFPWDNIAVKRIAEGKVALFIPGTEVTSTDTTVPMRASLRILELVAPGIRDVEICRWSGRDDDCDGPADDVAVKITEGGCVVVFPWDKNVPYRLTLGPEGVGDTTGYLTGIFTWDEVDLRTGASESASEERTLAIPPLRTGPGPQFELIQDHESRPPHVRTFSLALVNGDTPVEGVEIQLKALPQPDGTVPQIIAMGPIDSDRLVIKHGSKVCGRTPCFSVEQALAPGEVFRPFYITVAGSQRNALDAVEVEYTIRNRGGDIIQKGVVWLEGSVSKASESEEEPLSLGGVEIGSIMPNPANETATIALRSRAGAVNVEVALYDAVGRRVATLLSGATLPAGTTALPAQVGTLPSGVYTVVVRSVQGTAAQRFVVTH